MGVLHQVQHITCDGLLSVDIAVRSGGQACLISHTDSRAGTCMGLGRLARNGAKCAMSRDLQAAAHQVMLLSVAGSSLSNSP